MGKAWEWMKEHPYATAGIIFGVGLVFVLLFFRGSGATQATGPSDYQAYQAAAASEAASGNQLAAYQQQTQAAANQTAAGVAANANDNATALAIATLTAQTSSTHDQIAADSAAELQTIQGQTTLGVSTLAAQVATTQSNNSTLQNLFDTLVSQNAPMTTNDVTTWAPGGTTHTITNTGSYGQSIAGNIGGTSIALSVTPLVSPTTPWGANQSLLHPSQAA